MSSNTVPKIKRRYSTIKWPLQTLAKINAVKNKILTHTIHRQSVWSQQRFFINHVHKAIYVENPKCASRTILERLGTIEQRTRFHDIVSTLPQRVVSLIFISPLRLSYIRFVAYSFTGKKIAETRDWLKKSEKKYHLFTFTRNPFDRVVSGFCHKIITEPTIPLPNNSEAKNWEEYLGMPLKNDAASFKAFVKKYFSQCTNEQLDKHFVPQVNLIDRFYSRYNDLEFIGKIERFEQDWKQMCTRFSIPYIANIHRNKGKLKKDYMNYYPDVETVQIVYERYKDDVKTFGYEKEYKELLQYVQHGK